MNWREVHLFDQGALPELEAHVYRQLINEAPLAIYICDAEGRIHLYNQAAVNLWGRTPAVGVDLWCGSLRIFRPDGTSLPLDECPMAITLKEGRAVRDVEIVIERPDGSRRNILPFPLPLHNPAGEVIGAVNMLVDITEHRQQLEAIRAGELAQAKLGAIVASSDDAIMSKTLDGVITSWNRSAERLFGYASEEVVGKSILTIVPPERHPEEAGILARLSKGERIEHFETQRVTRDGRLLDISLTVSPVRDSSGVIIGASKIARDITQKKAMEKEREMLLAAERHAREDAQRANRMKDEFLATLSHELRTPLNAIMGWAQMLASGKMSPADMKEAGQIIERNARTQKQLIDDLLDMSRIISGKLRLDIQRVEPISFIEAAIETIQPSADAKGIRIEKMLDPRAGRISGDPARLQQVVWNLLTNAIKFTPKGGRVQLLLQRVNSHLELTVSDTGQGINPEFLSHLFTRFSQADAGTNRKHGGLGLGLAIVKQLVELHGGTVRASSGGEGLGASFMLNLPLLILSPDDEEDRVHPRSPASLTLDSTRADLSGLKVLVVDDERDARELIRRLLKQSGADVVTAESADEAISRLNDSAPDVLISDIGMAEVDGYELLRRVRKMQGAGAKIPAIALTAFARSEDRTRALRVGYIAHVAKPVEPSELLATIAVVAGRLEEHA